MPEEESQKQQSTSNGETQAPEPSGWVNSDADKAESTQEQVEPSAVQKNLERPSAEEIYKQVARNAEAELKRSSVALAISGITGGLFMGLSGLGVALAMATLGGSPHIYFISRMFYPLGFIVVILGRSQLFTENTLYPVALVLAERRELGNTLRLWSIVLPSNVLGAFLFALLVAWTPAVPFPMREALSHLGGEAAVVPAPAIFWSGVMAGWIIATAAWLVSGSHSITGSAMMIWLLTYVVGLGHFAHCIATSGEILTTVLTHQIGWTAYPHWLLYAVLGNICGGVFMVTLLEYGQAVVGKSLEQETQEDLH